MNSISYGLAGGFGGEEFSGYTIPDDARIKEVHIYADQYVDAIQLCYETAGGATEFLPKVGGLGGSRYVFTLNEDEYLTAISGYTGWYVDSVRFHTNQRTSVLYGGESGEEEYHHEAPDGREIAGLFGRADWYLDAVGIITRPVDKPKPKAKKAPKATAKKSAPKKTATPKKPKREASAAEKPAPTPPESRKPRPKDLQKIKGIGPKFSQILVENGIVDLQAMANADVATLEQILEKAGPRYSNIADPTSWPKQAALAVKGDWDALEKLQAEL